MAVHFKTDTPKKLLNAFKKAIDEGHVTTWAYDTDGDFTHTPEQWKRLAWLRPKVEEGKTLTFFIVGPKDQHLTSEIYAVYHGRFIESMLRHCDQTFSEASATALPITGDMIVN